MFKKSRIVLYVGMVPLIGAWGIFALKTIQKELGVSQFLLYMLLAMLVYVVVFGIIAGRVDSKIQRQLFHYRDNCQPDKMLEGYLANSKVPTTESHSRVYYTNVAVAYMEMGNWHAAKDCLLQVPLPKEPTFLTEPSYMAVKNNLCLCHLALGEQEQAASCIAWMIERTKALRLKNSANTIIDKYENHTLQLMYLCQIAQGNDEGAESYFLKTIQMESTLLVMVEKQYRLAGLYQRRGALEQARQAYGYVAQNGGATWYAAAAQNELQKIA